MRTKSVLVLSLAALAISFGSASFAAEQKDSASKAKQLNTATVKKEKAKQRKNPSTKKAAAKNQKAKSTKSTKTAQKSAPHKTKARHTRHQNNPGHVEHPTAQQSPSARPSWIPAFKGAFNAPCFWDCSNFLAGIEFAYARQRIDFQTDFVAPATNGYIINLPLLTPINNYVHWDATVVNQGYMLGGLAGWQMRVCRFLFGIEGNLDAVGLFRRPREFTFQDYSLNNADWFAGTTLVDRGVILGLTTRWGYFVTPGFLPYVRAGIQTSRDNVTYQVYEGTTNSATGLSTIPLVWDVSSHKKRTVGVVLGVGVEFPAFIGPTTIRIEYNFTQMQNLVISDNVGPIIGTHNFREPQNNVLKFAWVWNLC